MESTNTIAAFNFGCFRVKSFSLVALTARTNQNKKMSCDLSRGIGFAFWEKMSENADKIAQIDGLTGEKDTYGSLLRRCIRAAITMRSKGITSEDVVITCSLNYLDTSIPLIAGQFLGAISSALDPTLSLKDIVHLLKQITPKLIFVMPAALDLIEKALEEVGLDIEIIVFGPTTKHTPFADFLQANPLEEVFRPIEIRDETKTGLILFSSGTTGMPKGICIKNLTFLRNTSSLCDSGYYTDVNLITTSLYWITANMFLTATILMGTARILLPKFNATQVWNAIKQYEPKMIFAPPLQLVELASHKLEVDDISCSLKYILTSGVTIFQKHLDVLTSAFPKAILFQLYGQTETGIISTFHASNPEDMRLLRKDPLSVGKILPEYCYQIVDIKTEEVLGPNKSGELHLKGEIIHFNGYFNVDSSDVWSSNGWYKTGDIAYHNEDGCLYIVDRLKEMLKYQSWHVPPAAIEQVLVTHPAVQTCLVIGIPHELDGDHPMAVVVLKKSHQDTSPEEIRQFVESQVDDRKKLRGGVKIIQRFPTFITGKIKRKVIKDMIISGEL